MAKYNKQDFEAIAVYDYKKEANTQAAVVIDPEYSAVALCFYDSKGGIEASTLWNENNSVSIISSMAKVNPDLEEWKASREAMKAALTDFYMTSQTMDSTAFSGSSTLSASALMDLYKQCGGNELDNAVKSANAMLVERAVPLTNIRILLVGDMGAFFPAECIARLCFSPLMPMLPDNRFAVIPDTTIAIVSGNEIISNKKSKKLVDSVEWIIHKLDSQNQLVEYSVCLAEAQTPVDDFVSAVFKDDTVFAANNDQLTVKFNGAQQQLSIPAGFIPEGGALLQLGLVCENESFSLLLKSDRAIEKIPLNVNVRGE